MSFFSNNWETEADFSLPCGQLSSSVKQKKKKINPQRKSNVNQLKTEVQELWSTVSTDDSNLGVRRKTSN